MFYLTFTDSTGRTICRPTDDMYDAASKATGLAMCFHIDVHILDENKVYMFTITTNPDPERLAATLAG